MALAEIDLFFLAKQLKSCSLCVLFTNVSHLLLRENVSILLPNSPKEQINVN